MKKIKPIKESSVPKTKFTGKVIVFDKQDDVNLFFLVCNFPTFYSPN